MVSTSNIERGYTDKLLRGQLDIHYLSTYPCTEVDLVMFGN
jgi:hypothetical protein